MCDIMVPAVFVVIVMFGAAVADEIAGAREALACFNRMSEENNITHLLINVRTQEQIEYFCGNMRTNMKCIADNEHFLNTSHNTALLQQTSGIFQFFLNICPPGLDLAESYRLHAPCFSLAQQQMIFCNSILPSVELAIMKEPRSRCCVLRVFRECLSESVELKCGDEAGNITRQMVQRYHKTFMNECDTLYPGHCEEVGGTWSYHEDGGKDTPNDEWTTTGTPPSQDWSEDASKDVNPTSNCVSLSTKFITMLYLPVSLRLLQSYANA